MPSWTPNKNPGRYAVEILNAMQIEGEHLLYMSLGEAACKTLQKKVSSFRASCRYFPLHPISQRIQALGLVSKLDFRATPYGIDAWMITSIPEPEDMQPVLDALSKKS